MHDKVQKPLRKRSLSLIDILDYRRHLQWRTEGDKRSLVVSYYASVCKGGKEGGRKEGRVETQRKKDRDRRQADGQAGGTVAPRFIQNGLNDGDNGGAQSAKRKPNPGRFVPFVPPTRWKPDHITTRCSQEWRNYYLY